MVSKDGPVTQFAYLTFIDADARGLKCPVIRFEVNGVEAGSFHPDIAAFLDQALRPAEEPELPTSDGIEPTGRAKQMLGWVYAACQQGNWPVFQEGVFDPAGDSDLAGCYHLPTRVGPRMLPFQLFQVLLKWLLHPSPSNGKAGISAALAPLQAQFKRHALVGSNCRWVYGSGDCRESHCARLCLVPFAKLVGCQGPLGVVNLLLKKGALDVLVPAA